MVKHPLQHLAGKEEALGQGALPEWILGAPPTELVVLERASPLSRATGWPRSAGEVEAGGSACYEPTRATSSCAIAAWSAGVIIGATGCSANSSPSK